ncbi:MFS transporter [Alphaproteobacteria bacterium KMM 3653]|uniref:MFS transporter n=1 Tax=Harenicola maris TaxID=2841044 RepID=A0AAP2CTK5_9RHOB|nr:MFS transporter [Harenicola maris]
MDQKTLRKRIWGWMAFDIATQPYYTLVLTFFFGPYFVSVVTGSFMAGGMDEMAADAQAQSVWSLGQTVTGLFIAFSAPLLGAVADTTGRRMPWIYLFSGFYVIGAFGLWVMVPDGSMMWWALVAFGIGLVGAEFTTIFTNALLPDLGSSEEIGKISGMGYALGYAGGLVSVLVMLCLFAENEAGVTFLGLTPPFGLDAAAREGTRFVGPYTALWFMAFMAVFFLWVKEPRVTARVQGGTVRASLASLKASLVSVLRIRTLAAYLGSSMLYRDALNALYGFGGTYAVLVLDWSLTQVGIFAILGVITAGLSTWAGGHWDSRVGPKPVIIAMIAMLIVVCIVIVGMSKEQLFGVPLAEGSPVPTIVFYFCGAVIGGAGGVIQSASRSMMVRHANPERPTEAFGLYALSGKATAFLGPALILVFTQITGSARLGIAPVIGLFLIALVLLIWVKPEGTRAKI